MRLCFKAVSFLRGQESLGLKDPCRSLHSATIKCRGDLEILSSSIWIPAYAGMTGKQPKNLLPIPFTPTGYELLTAFLP